MALGGYNATDSKPVFDGAGAGGVLWGPLGNFCWVGGSGS